MLNSHKQQKDAQEAVRKMRPVIQNTKNQVFVSASKKLGKQLNVPKHEICKNIERKMGSNEAKKAFKTL